MNTPEDSSLGRDVAYPSTYDAGLLFPIPRLAGRNAIGIGGHTLPFIPFFGGGDMPPVPGAH